MGINSTTSKSNLQCSNVKILFNGEEIGSITDDEFDFEFGIQEESEFMFPEPIAASFRVELNNTTYKHLKRLFKLPRKLKKKIYGTRKARNKLRKLINARLPITVKQFKRAGYIVKIKK